MSIESPRVTPDLYATARAIDSALTGQVKDYALARLNADLVGIANIERFANAPVMMSPRGILPTARSVVVMAIHHPDSCIELDGREHPQKISAYHIQGYMNMRLDEMAFRLAKYLERAGYPSVPIVSSNIWRYKGYKDLSENFAPDLSHRHAAVAAGIADFGVSGLAITPEFGARQRYITVITEASLTPSPLLAPGSQCDDCGLCRRFCRAKALSEELDGVDVVTIEGLDYTYARKNLWRCAWGEHFDLDLDLPIPAHVDEAVILETARAHGQRGGEMGSCLRHCLPRARRYFDPGYTDAPRRKKASPQGDEPHRGFEERLLARAYGSGVDVAAVLPTRELAAMGLDLADYLPGGRTAICLGAHTATPASMASWYTLASAAYDVTRELERRGYNAIMYSDGALPERTVQQLLTGALPGRAIETVTVVTDAELSPTTPTLPAPAPAPASSPAARQNALKRLLNELGADLVGVAPAERIAALRPQLDALFGGKVVFTAHDRAGRLYEYDPEIREEHVQIRAPEDHLPGAKSVLVIGLALPQASVERAMQPPAESVGIYAFAHYEALNLLGLMAFRAARLLEDQGYRAAVTYDLCGTGALSGTPRGELSDLFSNRFAAVSAGLGRLGRGGFVLTPDFGPNVRFVAIVTDAEIAPDAVPADAAVLDACADCGRCLRACHTEAFAPEATVRIDEITERFHPIERARCEWAKRYSLIGAEGVACMGWPNDCPAPEEITADALAAALRTLPKIERHHPCNIEQCALACPLARMRHE